MLERSKIAFHKINPIRSAGFLIIWRFYRNNFLFFFFLSRISEVSPWQEAESRIQPASSQEGERRGTYDGFISYRLKETGGRGSTLWLPWRPNLRPASWTFTLMPGNYGTWFSPRFSIVPSRSPASSFAPFLEGALGDNVILSSSPRYPHPLRPHHPSRVTEWRRERLLRQTTLVHWPSGELIGFPVN